MLQRNMEVLPTSTVPAMMEPFLSYIWKPLVALMYTLLPLPSVMKMEPSRR